MSVTDYRKEKISSFMDALDAYIDERVRWLAADPEWRSMERVCELGHRVEEQLTKLLEK